MTPGATVSDQPARILIVDDEPHNRRVLETMLTPDGYLLSTAASGADALEMLAKQPFDLILLDVMMPGLDGFQVATRIKSVPATKHIPIIMVTALDNRDARMLGLSAGAEDFLTKPVDRAELSLRVRNLLRLKAYGDYYDKYSQVLEGKVGARTAALVDEITQRRKVEADLLLLTERLSLATSVARLGVWEWDLDANSLIWDATMFDIYGFAAVVPMPYEQWSAAVCPEDLPAVEASLQKAIDEKGRGSAEFRIRLSDGAVKQIAAVENVVLDVSGKVRRVIGVNMDVTERKQAEEAREQQRQDAIRFKDEFLSHVSHELRSPLTAIKQFTSILENGLAGELNTEQHQYQQIVLKNVGQLQAMIDDLLEGTRLETGKVTIEATSVPVRDAVTDSLDTLRGAALAKRIALSADLAPDLPLAYADPTRLVQILIILLDNAIKFTPADGRVSIHAYRAESDRQFLQLDISDTGCGIRPEMIGQIFDRLYQVSGSVDSSRKGLGLGLYICKQLVTRQGGRIWASSRLQHGTTVSFTLPVFSLNNPIAPLLKNHEAVAP
jgi:PAS domain S-box-containing protein